MRWILSLVIGIILGITWNFSEGAVIAVLSAWVFFIVVEA